MSVITELTDEQQALMPVIRDKWIKAGLCTDPANRPVAESAIRRAYRSAGLAEPERIVWCGSPLSQGLTRFRVARNSVWVGKSVVDSVNSVGKSVVDSVRESVEVGKSVRASVLESVYGQHDAAWLAFYDFFREIGLTGQTEKLAGLTAYSQHAGWCLPHENICWCAERHNILKVDDQGRLHCETGPACAYPDGWSIYAWHGIRVPATVITQKDKLTVEQIISEKNTECRRAMRNLYGNERFMRDAGAKEIDSVSKHGAKLLAIQLPGDPVQIRMVELTCPSTGNKYMERVPPDVGSAIEALSWRFNVKPAGYRPQWET